MSKFWQNLYRLPRGSHHVYKSHNMPVDLSEVGLDPDLGSQFCIIRNGGTFGPGGWLASKPCQIPAFGVIQPATPRALLQVPAGDRVEGSIQIICDQAIYQTLEDRSATSDTVMYQGNEWRVQNVAPWISSGYWSAILVRKTGS